MKVHVVPALYAAISKVDLNAAVLLAMKASRDKDVTITTSVRETHAAEELYARIKSELIVAFVRPVLKEIQTFSVSVSYYRSSSRYSYQRYAILTIIYVLMLMTFNLFCQ